MRQAEGRTGQPTKRTPDTFGYDAPAPRIGLYGRTVQEFSVAALVSLPSTAALPDLPVQNAERDPDFVGFARPEGQGWQDVTNAQFLDEVQRLARGLIAHGIAAGDRVGIMSRTRYEWTLLDFAIWAAGGVPVPIYDSSSPDQISWILSDSAAVACIVETPRLSRSVEQVRGELPDLRHLWVITDDDLDSISARADEVPNEMLAQRRATLTQDSLATIIYTSGTTGRPKGCELTHGNFLNCANNCIESLPDVVGVPNASTLLFLPLAHVFARLIEVLCVSANVKLAHTPTITDLAGKLQSFQPTFLLAVPRVFEKLFVGAQQRAAADGKGGIFDRAADVAVAYSQGLDSGQVPILVRVQHAVFEKLVYSKIRAAMGGEVKWAVSGGAPLGERLGHFFRGMGITILEGYGLTETTAPSTVNAPTAIRVGTVGRPIPGCSIRIEDDGEVMVRGPHVFRGYRGDPATTAASLDSDSGWYRTGDIGVLEDGYLRITGRKKEILVTAGGKNVAPAPLENVITRNVLVGHAVVLGDNRPYVAALITLDPEQVPLWLKGKGRENTPPELLVEDPEVRAAIQSSIDEANRTVSAAEAIKRFVVLPTEFTEETGHLTPKMSVKRHVVLDDFAPAVESLYV